MAYDPNQAGLFNKLIQSGLSTANAALQSGITDSKDFALGNNGNLGGLIPGANAVLGPGDTFQNVNFAQTVSGQPAQGVQLAAAAPFVVEGILERNGTITFVPPTATPGPTTSGSGVAPPAPLPQAPPLPNNTVTNVDVTGQTVTQSIVIPPRPVTGLDLTVPGQLVQTPSELGRSTTAPEVVTAAQLGSQTFPSTPAPAITAPAAAPSPTAFSATDPRVTVVGPPSVVVTTSDAARDAAISASRPGYDQAPPVTDTNIAGGIRAQDVGPANSAPAPQLVPTQTLDPATAQQALTTAPAPPNESAAETARLAAAGNADPKNYVETFAPPPVQADDATGVDKQVAANAEADALANQSAAESKRLANQQAAAEANTIQQAALEKTYKQPGNNDWRFRISLAENSNYLYSIINNSEKGGGAGAANSGPGILAPLANTGGVIFPYTPQVTSSYQAKYNTYELVHSNYRGAFYQSSYVGDINIRGVFTAQDTTEAAYMLAVIHFFRSVTKMFYGQDAQRGAPPPLVFLTGLGDYQYNRHPAVVTQFDYTLPNDVDYIRATNPNNFGTDLLNRRTPTASSPVKGISAIGTRLLNALLTPGAESGPPARAPITNSVTNTARATYVPTKIEISLTLMPMQTRDQVSKLFSLEKFANGSLLSGGFW